VIDHITVPVKELSKSKIFYEKILVPLNYSISFGEEEKFWAFDIAGGKCNGAPGLRPQYSDTYYAAFIVDPSGHNVEVVCHELR
jgi:predicted lactoylglutathione lyase